MPIPVLLIGALVAAGAGGLGAGATGAAKMSHANQIINVEKKRYDEKKEEFDKTEEKCNNTLEKLGVLKLNVWRDFELFSKTFERIKNKPQYSGSVADDKYSLPTTELDDIKKVSISAVKVLGVGVIAAGAGGAVAGGALSGVAAFGVASTGTAIASLSGAAATNATFAAIGGGSLASGGLGIAGGTAILGGMVAAPALAIAGIFMVVKGNSSIEKADEVKHEVSKAISSFDKSIVFLDSLHSACQSLYTELYFLHKLYLTKVNELSDLVNVKNDFSLFTEEERGLLETNILLVKLLKSLTQVEILKKDNDNSQYVDTDAVKETVEIAKAKRKSIMA